MLTTLPEIELPAFDTELATSTPMYDGTAPTGGVLFPGRVVHGPPHAAGGVLVGSATAPAKPLNAFGAPPAPSAFSDDHGAAHQVNDVAGVAPATVRSPST